MIAAQEFSAFIASLGFEPPPKIEPGRFVRFSTNGRRDDEAGYAKLFPDGEGGIVGDWRSGQKWPWQATRERPRNEDEQRAWRERIEREQREAQALREREQREAAERARAIWEKAQAAEADHAYLARKGVKAHGLRIYRGPLAIKGMRCDGALVVPVRNITGELQTLELIAPDRPEDNKRFLQGGRKSGGYLAIGKPQDVVCIVEGYATGASVHEATGHAVAVAFDAGNLAAVAKALRAKFPKARIVLCADNDVHPDGRANDGLVKAKEAADAVGGVVAIPELDGVKCDFNDVARSKGTAAVRAAIEAVLPPAEPKPEPSGLITRCIADVEARPVSWLWPGRIARGKVSMMAGHPGLGKSQLCASLAAIVSTGGLWPVDRTRSTRGNVLIVSAEDDVHDTIRPRLEAAGADLARCHVLDAVQIQHPDGTVTRRGFSLEEDMPRLSAELAELRDVALVVIDPVTAYLGATDSHKAAEVRAVLAALAEVAALHATAVVAVSHLRKGGGVGDALMQVTGSMAFVAAARAAYIVAKDQGDPSRRLVLPAKNNLGNDQTGYAFRVEPARLQSGIETSRIAWEGAPVTVTADEALAPPQVADERSAVEDAADFLRGLLADGPVSAKQVRADAEGAGHSWAAVRRAQKGLGVEVTKAGLRGGWEWRLPPKVLNKAEGAQEKDVSAFGHLEHLREPNQAEDGERGDDGDARDGDPGERI